MRIDYDHHKETIDSTIAERNACIAGLREICTETRFIEIGNLLETKLKSETAFSQKSKIKKIRQLINGRGKNQTDAANNWLPVTYSCRNAVIL